MTRNVWQKPQNGWIKLNTDGSFSSDGLSASIGGLRRDSKGHWLFGFKMKLFTSEILQIEAAAIVSGLKVAWNKGYRRVELECDNAHVVDIVHSGLAPLSKISDIQKIHVLCCREWSIQVRCIPRKLNMVADHSTRRSNLPMGRLVFLDEPPHEVFPLFQAGTISTYA